MEGRRVSIQMHNRDEAGGQQGEEDGERINAELSKNTEVMEPFMGMKARRRSSAYLQYHGDYLNVPCNQQILKLLTKQGDKQVLFADSVMKVNSDGQIRRRILVITDFALYILDYRWCNLKRRISLSAIDQLYMSEHNDNFLAVIVPSEYDFLLASTRKSEIVTVLVNAIKNTRHTPLEVSFANRFEYRVDCEASRVVHFESTEGGVNTRITRI
ncbi:hypothetical protein KP509_07G002600 [Ceratopteris richardii]|uniref:TH1 domain-containing protein n=1 Tax=Ceratopteris richardii TaxID=49495 RepID=A0A8T2UHU4_CERRI|nr:hypothetical protein KP509_07G002600 [Ceratopteris richardii]